MARRSFRQFCEANDIFGFQPTRAHDERDDNMLSRPIRQFDIETMMEILSHKKIGPHTPDMPFTNIIRWGTQPGAIKLEIDTGYTFYIKKLGMDKQGHPRWVTKRMFQLNRQGYGGLEDKVAEEIHEYIENYYDGLLDGPVEDYKDLENLVSNIYNKLKRTAKVIFLPEGIRKLSDDAYIIQFGVRGQGVEEMDHRRVEQNQTLISYDREQGTIRITNYNVTSPTGGAHEWTLGTNDLDVYFFPTQSRDEISECISIQLKYY